MSGSTWEEDGRKRREKYGETEIKRRGYNSERERARRQEVEGTEERCRVVQLTGVKRVWAVCVLEQDETRMSCDSHCPPATHLIPIHQR